MMTTSFNPNTPFSSSTPGAAFSPDAAGADVGASAPPLSRSSSAVSGVAMSATPPARFLSDTAGPVHHNITAIVPLRLLTTREEVNDMRNPTVISELVELIEDVKAGIHALAILDGVICEREERLMQIADEALWKALDTQNGFILAKNVLDNGGIVANAQRRDREHKRDMAILRMQTNVVNISDYRNGPQNIA